MEAAWSPALSRPGGNVTGFSIQLPDLAGKRIELLLELIPGLRRLAIIANVANPNALLEVAEARSAAHKLGFDVEMLEVRRAEDIVPAFGTLKNNNVQALYVSPDPMINANHARINILALGARLPTIHPFRDYLAAGGLMSYGANNADMFRRSAEYVDKILQGGEAGGAAGPATDQDRAGHQSGHRQGARHRRAAEHAGPRRRGDR